MNVQCKQCLAMADLPAGTDPHSRTWCGCCAVTDEATGQPHHHGRDVLGAADCEAANHPGAPCWNPPGTPRPDGCTACRPIIHFPVAGDLAVI